MPEADFELASPIDWHPHNLTNSLVIMSPIPSQFLDPLYGIKKPEEFGWYLRTFQNDIVEVLGREVIDDPSGKPPASYYLVPPAAGPYTDFIFAIASDVHSFIQSIDAYIALGGTLIQLLQRRKRRDKDLEEDNPYRRRGTYVGLRAVEAMCLHHAHELYYDPSRHPQIKIESYSRGEHVGAVDHPSAGTHYVVTIHIGSANFVYVASADCKVIEHFKVEGARTVGLERPNWLAGTSGNSSVEAVVQSTSLISAREL